MIISRKKGHTTTGVLLRAAFFVYPAKNREVYSAVEDYHMAAYVEDEGRDTDDQGEW